MGKGACEPLGCEKLCFSHVIHSVSAITCWVGLVGFPPYNEEYEVQRGKAPCPRSHSQVTEPGCIPRDVCLMPELAPGRVG